LVVRRQSFATTGGECGAGYMNEGKKIKDLPVVVRYD
jgi:hypothetical protein